MHTVYSRINNVSAMLSTCLMVLLGAISLSSFLFTADPKGDLSVATIQVYVWTPFMHLRSLILCYRFPGNARRYHNKNQDFAFINFNVTAGQRFGTLGGDFA